MTLLLLVIILSIIALACCEIFHRRFEECLALACFFIIFTLYVFGLFDFLLLGFYCLLIVSGVSAAFLLSVFIRKKKIQSLTAPGIVIFLAFTVFLWWTHRTRVLIDWDEFSHWGLVSKNYFYFNTLHKTNLVTTLYPGYPPAVPLFQLFSLKLSGTFTENTLYRSLNILNFAMLLPIIKTFSWKNWKPLLLSCVLLFVTPLCFYEDFYTSIYVDGVLGVSFFYVIYSFLTEEKYDYFYYISLFLGIFFLVLVKSPGAGLAVMAILFQVFFAFSKKEKAKTKRNRIGLVVTIFAFLFGKYSWDIFLSLTNTPIAWETINQLSFSNFFAFLSGNGMAFQYTTLNYFIIALFTYIIAPSFLPISYFGYIMIFIVASAFLFYLLNDKQRKAFRKAILSLIIFSIVYQFSLLVLYLFTYSEHEAINLASFTRYTATHLLGMFLILLAYYINHGLTSKKLQLVGVGIATILLFFNWNPLMNITFRAPGICGGDIEFRKKYQGVEKIQRYLDPNKDKVYFVSIHDSGYDIVVTRYLLTPISTVPIPWSIGEPYEYDIWTIDFTVEELVGALELYEATHLYILYYNDSFANKYGALFEKPDQILNNQLYQIVYKEGYVVFVEVYIPE